MQKARKLLKGCIEFIFNMPFSAKIEQTIYCLILEDVFIISSQQQAA